MNETSRTGRRPTLLAALLLGAAPLTAIAAAPYTAPQTDATPTAKALKKLPARAERVSVTVMEVRSNVGAVDPRAATDMFKTALVQTRQFRVVERQRLAEGVGRERQLEIDGYTAGGASQRQLTGAQYVFEVAISEANAAEVQRSGGVAVAGAQVGGGSTQDSLAIDVRLVSVETGEIMDAVRVVKPVQAKSSQASGIGNLIDTIRRRQGKDTTYTPDIRFQQERREGVNSALRAALDEAALQIAKRFEE
jgi:curli biogenesis system outer membrane secretion channel CsgG